MDPQREQAVIKYIATLWDKDVSDIIDLQDGHFFVHVLDLLDHGPERRVITTDENRLMIVKKFLQDYYGKNICLDDYLQFDTILNRSCSSLVQVKMELAKIAVVLLGIGLLDKNREIFMDAALLIPDEVQKDILAVIQSVILPDSTEVVLTNRIELVLRGTDGGIPPVLNILTSDSFSADSDKVSSRSPAERKPQSVFERTPLRSSMSHFNISFHDICSPFKSLDIKSTCSPVSSPLVDFVQSPQMIQKAVLKQKDFELRKLQEQLAVETMLKEEAQLALRESQSARSSQDIKITKLRQMILEIQGMEEVQSELLDLQQKYQKMEAEYSNLKEKIKVLLIDKDILEKENISQEREISALHLQMKSLETNHKQHKELLEVVEKLEQETKFQELELAKLKKLSSEWELEKAAYICSLKTARGMNKQLQKELEELQVKQNAAVLPNGLSMAHEPELQKMEWDTLNQTVNAAKKDVSSLPAQNDTVEKSPVKSKRVRTPRKREITDETSSTSWPKQRKGEGTVRYFPLDPNGPVYPPPLPSSKHRWILGRYVPTSQDTSYAILPKNNHVTMESHRSTNMRTSVANLATIVPPDNTKLKSSSRLHDCSKYVPIRNHSYKLRCVYKYKVTNNILE